MSIKSDAIAAELSRRYPCGAAPTGSWSAIAAEFKVSREYVRQLAVKIGIESTRVDTFRPARLCQCGQPVTLKGARLCESCRHIPVACIECGKVVERPRNDVLKVNRNATGLMFCGYRCLGLYYGARNGIGSPLHPIRRKAAARREQCLERLCAYHLEHGTMPRTWAAMDAVTGVSSSRGVLIRLRDEGIITYQLGKPWTMSIVECGN